MDSVALLEDTLQNKLRTALHALFPTATFTIHFVDSVTGDPVNCQCVLCTLTGTGGSTTVHAIGDTLTLTGLKPGNYTLEMDAACLGYAINTTVFNIVVDDQGNATFNGVPVDEVPPPEIELTEDPFAGRAAPADDQYTVSTLTNHATGDTSVFYPEGGALTLPRLEPGSYTLRAVDVYAGYARSEKAFEIKVCAAGKITVNGIPADENPPVIDLFQA